MDRAQLEAVIWKHWPTRGSQATRSVDAILAASYAYAVSMWPPPGSQRPACPCHVLHHTSDSDLHPVIGALAGALLGDQPGPVWDREAAMGDAF